MLALYSSAVITPVSALHLQLELLLSSLHSKALLAGAESHEGGEVPVVGCQQGSESQVLVFSRIEGPLTESFSVLPESVTNKSSQSLSCFLLS